MLERKIRFLTARFLNLSGSKILSLAIAGHLLTIGSNRSNSSNRSTRSDSSSNVGQNNVARLLGDHVDRRHDEKARNFRKDRGIDDAHPLGAVSPKFAVHDAVFFARSDGAASRSVMTPGVFL